MVIDEKINERNPTEPRKFLSAAIGKRRAREWRARYIVQTDEILLRCELLSEEFIIKQCINIIGFR